MGLDSFAKAQAQCRLCRVFGQSLSGSKSVAMQPGSFFGISRLETCAEASPHMFCLMDHGGGFGLREQG